MTVGVKGRGTAGSETAQAHDPPSPTSPPRRLDRIRHATRVRHFAIRTDQTYVGWARRFILLPGKRQPQDVGAPEAGAFLTHLAPGSSRF